MAVYEGGHIFGRTLKWPFEGLQVFDPLRFILKPCGLKVFNRHSLREAVFVAVSLF